MTSQPENPRAYPFFHWVALLHSKVRRLRDQGSLGLGSDIQCLIWKLTAIQVGLCEALQYVHEPKGRNMSVSHKSYCIHRRLEYRCPKIFRDTLIMALS